MRNTMATKQKCEKVPHHKMDMISPLPSSQDAIPDTCSGSKTISSKELIRT